MSASMSNAKLYFCRDYAFEPSDFYSLLSKERADKAQRLRLAKDKKNCVGAYLLLKYALKKEGIEQFEVFIGQNGKPYLKNVPLFFNISHTDSGFVCAVSESEVGVDIQSKKEPTDRMVKKICSPKEYDRIISSKSFADDFIRLWTLKESVIKKNAGILADYEKYEFTQGDTDFYKFGLHFISFETDDAIISLCGEFEKAELFNLSFCEIINTAEE